LKYDFIVEYKVNKENLIIDALSTTPVNLVVGEL
jgi:hypothetical protein